MEEFVDMILSWMIKHLFVWVEVDYENVAPERMLFLWYLNLHIWAALYYVPGMIIERIFVGNNDQFRFKRILRSLLSLLLIFKSIGHFFKMLWLFFNWIVNRVGMKNSLDDDVL